jgi:hypothetical protein
MAKGKSKSRRKGATKSGDRPAWLYEIGRKAVPIILTLGGLVGFVALAGSAVVWTRFMAVEVPPDQIVAIYPRSELVAIAAAFLLMFGLAGLLAVAMCYLIDRRGRASLGMTRALITILCVEGLAVIASIAPAASWQQRVLAAESYALPLVACLWVTFLAEKPKLFKKKVRKRLEEMGRSFKIMLGVAIVALLGLSALVLAFQWCAPAMVAIFAGALFGAVPSLWLVWKLREGKNSPSRRRLKRFNVPFTRNGMIGFIGLQLAAVAAPGAWLHSVWLLLSLAAATLLVAGLWRAAVLPKKNFLWYGVAVFVSVPLFGAITWTMRNVFEPQVQPMALIRKSGGTSEYLEGIYVAETDSRVYFATLATRGCSKDVVADSGRLLSVPKSEVAAMAIGPLQGVSQARRSAQEIAFALAPQGTIPARGGERRTDFRSTRSESRRLEEVPAAVEPSFGAGLRLVPEVAAPGESVTLYMDAPSEDGFGRSREHRTLRVGGVPVDILKENARTPSEAEYVETENGRLLKVGKQSVYVEHGSDFASISPSEKYGQHLFVRVSDSSVAEVAGPGDGSDRQEDDSDHAKNRYLQIERVGGRYSVASIDGEMPTVRFRNGPPERLRPSLVRQNWHKDHISFRVPRGSHGGQVTVDCEALGSSPELQFAHPLTPRISARVRPGSDIVVLDSSEATSQRGGSLSRRWTIDGVSMGQQARLEAHLPSRRRGYSVRLTVRDASGHVGTTRLYVFRLAMPPHEHDSREKPSQRLSPQTVNAIRNAISSLGPNVVELAGHPGGSPKPGREFRLKSVEELGHEVLRARNSLRPGSARKVIGLEVRDVSYDWRCPADDQDAEGRLDVFVLGDGAHVAAAPNCPPASSQTTHEVFAQFAAPMSAWHGRRPSNPRAAGS